MLLEDSYIEDHLKCGICHEILIEPVDLACAHMFCEFCIERWLEKHTNCPMCRAKVPSDPADPGKVVVNMADGDRVIDHVVRTLPPDVQEGRRAAKRLRVEVIEKEIAAKRRRLDVELCREQGQHRCLMFVTSSVLAALLVTMTYL